MISVTILATTCQSKMAQVLVETGPYFGGSISIEPYFKKKTKTNKDIKVARAYHVSRLFVCNWGGDGVEGQLFRLLVKRG